MNEKQRRLLAAADAQILGYGGTTTVARALGMSKNTISRGREELKTEAFQSSQVRIRKPGGGRKPGVNKDPGLLNDLDQLIDPFTIGDPESPLRWICKSVRKLSQELNTMGHKTSNRMVAELLKAMHYSLQANKKTREGDSHPDRHAQFEYINTNVKSHQEKNQPVISVDSKKKELVGNLKNNGREWRPEGYPEEVLMYDFLSQSEGRVCSYGVYDQADNSGWVIVGIDHDTAAFAVESIRRWWFMMGKVRYSQATRLIITADGGGSNGARVRLWKTELQKLSTELGLEISVFHYPPGTSKWNKIEHCLFSFITQNWRGKPLINHEVIIKLIASTRTKSGLTVQASVKGL